MSQQEEINTKKNIKVSTECVDCFFAKWSKSGLNQIGCSLDKLAIFKKNGRVTEVLNEETNQIYSSINTICQFKRDEVWAKQYKDPVTRINEETKLETTYICLANSPKLAERFVKKLNELKSKKNPSKAILVVTYFKDNAGKRDVEARNLLSRKDKTNNEIPLHVVYSLDEERVGIQHVDSVISQVSTLYYTVWEKPQSIKSNVVHRLNGVVNGLLKRAIMFDSGSNDGSTFHTYVHKMFAGNKEKDLRLKIKEAALDQQDTEAIYELKSKKTA